MRKSICVIVNPFSGVWKKQNLATLLEQNLDKQLYDWELIPTEYPGHATILASEAVAKGMYMVVAAGGDGTVNEIASALRFTDTILGILPGGSGNGLSMYLGIGRKLKHAIQVLNQGQARVIDTATVNDRCFVNIAGIGFDGVIAYRSKQDKLRGLFVYVKHTLLESLRYKSTQLVVEVDGAAPKKVICTNIIIANAAMFGYNFVIAPQAKLDDGVLDIVVLKEATMLRMLYESRRMLNNSILESKYVYSYTAKKINITPVLPTGAHVDGEGFPIADTQHFAVVPQSLKIWVPKDSRAFK